MNRSAVRIRPSAPCRGVAQFGSALGSGPRGRWFKSSHLDQSGTSPLAKANKRGSSASLFCLPSAFCSSLRSKKLVLFEIVTRSCLDICISRHSLTAIAIPSSLRSFLQIQSPRPLRGFAFAETNIQGAFRTLIFYCIGKKQGAALVPNSRFFGSLQADARSAGRGASLRSRYIYYKMVATSRKLPLRGQP